MMTDVPESLRSIFDPAVAGSLIELRRELHRHPELSWQEVETAQRLRRALLDFGVPDVVSVGRTGLVVVVTFLLVLLLRRIPVVRRLV